MSARFFLLAAAIFACSACQDNTPQTDAVSETATENTTASASDAQTNSEAIGLGSDIPLGQLSKDIEPTHYRLHLTIIPDQDTFSGTTSIDLQVNKAGKIIWLHGNQLQVSDVSVTQGEQTFNGSYRQVDKTGVAQIELEQALQPGTAVIDITYEAPFNGALEGLYKVEEDNHAYAFTQFQATSARLAFPGFDEPDFKVTFDIQLTVKEDHVAVSTTPEVDVQNIANGMKTITYAKSKKLPTYLIAFAVGPFDVNEWEPIPTNQIRDFTIPLRGIAVKGKGEQMDYSLEHTAEILDSLENYFQIPYPYAKLDILAVPDFSAGAMENAGAITYRENLLLIDENSSIRSKRAYAAVHAHELAHQWFGNLVTPKWWDDIWLNEAFATWMAYTSLHNLNEADGYNKTLLNRSLAVMPTDSLISSRQIRQPIESNHDIASAFDGITYSKGGGVLAMFESFLGKENFRRGIEKYMNKYAFETTTADDFIESISAESQRIEPKIVAKAFKSFIEQPGLPIVEVTPQCEDGKAYLTVEQSRYLPLGSKGSTDQQWDLPLCLKYSIDGQVHSYCELVDAKSQVVELPDSGCPDFVMPNTQGAGYYRWSLPAGDWQNLLAARDQLTTEELMSASDSLDAALNAGKLSTIEYLETLPMLIEVDGWEVATAPISTLEDIREYLVDDERMPAFEARLQQLYGPRLTEIGLSGANDKDTVQLRTKLVQFMALEARQPELRSELLKTAQKYIGFKGNNTLNPDGVDQNTVGTALSVAVQELGKPFADALTERFLESRDATFRARAMNALGWSADPEVAADARKWVLSSELRDNEIYFALFQQLSNGETRDDAWEWLKDNVDGVIDRIPTWRQGRVASGGKYFCSEARKTEVNKFFVDRIAELEGGPRSLANTLEEIELCVAKTEALAADLNSSLAQ